MISLSVAIHVIGMFGLSLPVGQMTDRLAAKCDDARNGGDGVGRLSGCDDRGLLADHPGYLSGRRWLVLHQRFGLGADRGFGPGRRCGRAIGTNDTFSGAGAIALPLLGGPVVELFGLPALALISTGLMLIPFLMLLRLGQSGMGGLRDAVGSN